MTEFAISNLSVWANFYVILGSSAAALIGIQFVVITLVATRRKRPTADAIHAFSTPNVVQLGAALLVSALMTVPWPSLGPLATSIAVSGFAGLGYGVVVIRRTRRQGDYRPVWEDWLWYTTLPCGAYAGLALAGLLLSVATGLAVLMIGAAALALLLVGIHNAWDSVTHIVISLGDD